MRRLIVAVLIGCLTSIGLALIVRAESPQPEMVTREEALRVANNWIALIIHHEGHWGGSESAEVREIEEFKRGERVLGYFCSVKPQGFIVISLRRELAPVKAYSTVGDLVPTCDRGMVDVIKGGMERTLGAIEEQLGLLPSVASQDLQSILEIDHSESWEELGKGAEAFQASLIASAVMDYQGGDVLLSTAWSQGTSYNNLCPTGNTACLTCCPGEPGICDPTLPTKAGCVAMAGAQIMNYWGWPPHGTGSPSYDWDGDDSCVWTSPGRTLTATVSDAYDWAHMANRYSWDTLQRRWEDEKGDPLTQAHLDAVAELSYEIGVAAETDYGVCGSGAFHPDMQDAYEDNYYYSRDLTRRDRSDYSANAWFDRMKAQFDLNRPVQYGVPGHSLVSDGWKEIGDGKFYHMNYGWAGGRMGDPCWPITITNSNTWYALDGLPCSDPDQEDMIEDIYPVRALGDWVSGWHYPSPFPPQGYVYFDRDASGTEATFDVGHYLQFLPEVTVTCTSSSGGRIRFLGSSDRYTYLFTRGDPSRGIEIRGQWTSQGHVSLHQNGSIKFYKQ